MLASEQYGPTRKNGDLIYYFAPYIEIPKNIKVGYIITSESSDPQGYNPHDIYILENTDLVYPWDAFSSLQEAQEKALSILNKITKETKKSLFKKPEKIERNKIYDE
jgi:hypothetical protein